MSQSVSRRNFVTAGSIAMAATAAAAAVAASPAGASDGSTATGHIYRQLAARRAGPVVPRLVRAVKWEGIRPANARWRLPEPVAVYEPLQE